jgi:hypothetical protein
MQDPTGLSFATFNRDLLVTRRTKASRGGRLQARALPLLTPSPREGARRASVAETEQRLLASRAETEQRLEASVAETKQQLEASVAETKQQLVVATVATNPRTLRCICAYNSQTHRNRPA